jgi:HEXXH motif-containing protein
LVLALREKRNSDAAALFREIAVLARRRPRFAILPFSDAALGPGETARYTRLLGIGGVVPTLASPDQPAFGAFRRRVEAAMILLRQADETLATELRSLVLNILGATATGKRRFGSVSSFMLWGTILIDIDLHPQMLDVFEALAHEGAHHLLFAVTQDKPLTDNPFEDRFRSPLRPDPRPMDGVFHATFVCARLHYAYRRLAGAMPTLPAVDMDLVAKRLSDNHQHFLDGQETLRCHGRLTPVGERLLGGAEHYMQSAA